MKRLSDDYIREIGVANSTTGGDKPSTMRASDVAIWREVDGAWTLWADMVH